MKFSYLARNKKGDKQSGIVDAPNRLAALDLLHEHDLIVIRIRSEEKAPLFSKDIKFLNRVKRKEIFIFFRQLAILVGAGVPLLQSLRALGKQFKNKYFKSVIAEVVDDVDGGMYFSQAMHRHPKVFPSFCINLTKSAEVSGQLQDSLNYLADYLEREYYLISKVRGAMIYPLFILGVFIIIGIVVMVMVIPQLTSILTETGQELPWSTNVVIAVSNFIRNQGWLLLIIFALGVIGFWRYTKTEKGKALWDNIKIRIPIFGNILQQTYLARLADNLHALFKGGVSIIQSLSITADVVGNYFFKKALLEAREQVRVGKGISPSLEKYKEFPPLFCQMIKTGESTGKLELILRKLSDFYNKEVSTIVDSLTQLIEPILLVLLGLGVAVLVFAVFMPIYSLSASL